MTPARILAPLALCAALAVPVACGDGTGLNHSASGATSVFLTDDPFPYDSLESVNLYVVSIAASTGTDTSSSASWVTIAEPHRVFDMLQLQSGRTALAGTANIPAGQYHALRVIIDTDSSNIVTKQGFNAPIAWQTDGSRPSLYALVENPVSVSGDGTSIVIDFDIGRSFLCSTDGCTTFVFTPVLRAVDEAGTGSISGVVRGDEASGGHPVPHAAISIYTDSTEVGGPWQVVATTTSDDQGAYRVMFLEPGAYIVRADPPAGLGLTVGFLTHVHVTAGAETSGQDIILSSAFTGGPPASISITPNTASVEVGGLVQLSVILLDANGQATYAPVGWTTNAPDIVTVTGEGTVSGVAPGTATVTARVTDSLSATATITVLPAGKQVGSITISPTTLSLNVGDSAQMHATILDVDGNPVSRAVNWSAADSTIAFVFEDGMVRALKAGTTTITGEVEGKTDHASVTVH